MKTKMDRENRAKQFMPFAALKGYPEALKEAEKVWKPQIQLSEEVQEELNGKLCQIQKGDVIRVTYYCNGEYRCIAGALAKLEKSEGYLKIGETRIYFSRIYDMEIE